MARKSIADITDEQYTTAIALLENGGTKKAACQAMDIAYNVKRMDTLISDYKAKKAAEKRIRAEKRKQAMDKDELVSVITDYLSGDSFQELSDNYYRSTGSIKYYLEKHGAMLRKTGKVDYLNPEEFPDECVSNEFSKGDFVWSSKYGTVVEVVGKYKNAYRIYVCNDKVQENAYHEVCELGSLKHIEALGVDLSKLQNGYTSGETVIRELNAALAQARKNGTK